MCSRDERRSKRRCWMSRHKAVQTRMHDRGMWAEAKTRDSRGCLIRLNVACVSEPLNVGCEDLQFNSELQTTSGVDDGATRVSQAPYTTSRKIPTPPSIGFSATHHSVGLRQANLASLDSPHRNAIFNISHKKSQSVRAFYSSSKQRHKCRERPC